MIKRIEITNFKSIESLKLCIQNEHIIGILGKNGTGKSTLFHAVNYFFSKLNKQHSDDVVIDGVNPYVQKCTITISFNLARMFMKSKGNKELSEIMNFIQEYQQEFFGKVSDVLSITMIQYRDGRIVWSIDKKYQEKILNAIKRYFPIYFINVRNLDLQSWNKLWDIIGDLLMSVPRENVEHLKKLDEAFFAIYGERYIKSKQKIEDTFKEEGISLDPFSFRSRFKDVFKLRFGGEQFEFNERNLDYYSDGTNSYKYLKLLISLIPYVSELSCKHPLIMIDEPEIGLHSAFITELVECIHHSIEDKAVLLFTTHSPKVIEELTNQGVEYALYRTSDYRLHTILTKLNLQWLKDGKHTVTIKETECYFSDYLVYVEGESEVQLFQNKYLRRLFPNLRRIHFYPASSDNQKMHNVDSSKLNLGIEYRIVIDMDKIISPSLGNNRFGLKTKEKLNPLSLKVDNSYRFYNCGRSARMFRAASQKERILSLLDTKFDIASCHYIEDIQYNELVELIQDYCMAYRTIVNWSTIEGELLTYENYHVFVQFLHNKEGDLTKGKKETLNKILSIEDIKERTVLLLYACCGKLETMHSPLQPFEYVKSGILGGKTSGWISDWLTYYFETYLKIETISEAEARKEFTKHFPGLTRTLQELENMVQ